MENRFARFHPFVTFIYYAGALVLFILMLHPVFLSLGLVMMLVINYFHDRLSTIKKWLFFFITTVLLIMMMNPLFNQRGQHVLFEMGTHRVTLEAVVYGAMNAMSIISIIVLFISYNQIMTPNKLLFLFSKFFPQFAILLMLTLRCIPLMTRRLAEITAIQQSKGMSVSHGEWKTRAKTGMLYVQALLTYSLEEAIQTADSMKARGYGKRSRTSYEYFKVNKMDMFAIGFLIVAIAGLLYARISSYGYLTVYPVMESLKLSAVESKTLILYLLYLSFPIIVEAGEKIRWRLSN